MDIANIVEKAYRAGIQRGQSYEEIFGTDLFDFKPGSIACQEYSDEVKILMENIIPGNDDFLQPEVYIEGNKIYFKSNPLDKAFEIEWRTAKHLFLSLLPVIKQNVQDHSF